MATLAAPAVSAVDSALVRRLLECFFPGRPDGPEARADLTAQLRQTADSLDEYALSLARHGLEEGWANGAAKSTTMLAGQNLTRKQRKGRGNREFNFSRYAKRFVALELLYVGWDHHGFASVSDSEDTIEAHLFRALEKTRLIPPEAARAELCYSRCGRTDKGVSALGQVVALYVRSAASAEDGAESLGTAEEMNYPAVLNGVLPPTIRVLGWACPGPSFSARFSCLWREYKYFIQPRGPANLAAMQEAAAYFEGLHDFRHFCKLDAANVNHFVRRIDFFRVTPVAGCQWGNGSHLLEIHLRGSAFLWHQVRCMAAVLMMVGEGSEEPEVVKQFLNVDSEPLKPMYSMASETPLILYACGFDSLSFYRTKGLQEANCTAVESMLQEHLRRAGLLWAVAKRLREDGTAGGQPDPSAGKRPRHIPLSLRGREKSVEERMAKHGKVPLRIDEVQMHHQALPVPAGCAP